MKLLDFLNQHCNESNQYRVYATDIDLSKIDEFSGKEIIVMKVPNEDVFSSSPRFSKTFLIKDDFELSDKFYLYSIGFHVQFNKTYIFIRGSNLEKYIVDEEENQFFAQQVENTATQIVNALNGDLEKIKYLISSSIQPTLSSNEDFDFWEDVLTNITKKSA